MVMKWRRINRNRKPKLGDGRSVPDDNEEYLLYQTLVGAWPLRMTGDAERAEFICRIEQYMEKAVHEAKVNVSWLNPNPHYVAGMNDFLEKILSPSYRGKTNLFWDSLQKFLPAVIVLRCDQLSNPDAVKADLPRRTRRVPRAGNVGLQPGRSRQPAPS